MKWLYDKWLDWQWKREHSKWLAETEAVYLLNSKLTLLMPDNKVAQEVFKYAQYEYQRALQVDPKWRKK